jgi:hypothetical protein
MEGSLESFEERIQLGSNFKAKRRKIKGLSREYFFYV